MTSLTTPSRPRPSPSPGPPPPIAQSSPGSWGEFLASQATLSFNGATGGRSHRRPHEGITGASEARHGIMTESPSLPHASTSTLYCRAASFRDAGRAAGPEHRPGQPYAHQRRCRQWCVACMSPLDAEHASHCPYLGGLLPCAGMCTAFSSGEGCCNILSTPPQCQSETAAALFAACVVLLQAPQC